MRSAAADGARTPAFQSAPAIAGGRCRLSGLAPRQVTGFNPRPPLLAGDAYRAWRLGMPVGQFQSAPAIAGGRCQRVPCSRGAGQIVSIRARHCWRAMQYDLRDSDPGARFQSAPAIAGGRCHADDREDQSHGVSIRARHCWRAMPNETRHRPRCCSFNPRPPLLAGDARPPASIARQRAVSIRARHCWRAMQAATR